jgi:hypothetical protein
MVYFMILSVLHTTVHGIQEHDDLMTVGKDFKGSGHGFNEAPSQHFPGGNEKNHEKLRITGDLTEIRTWHFQITS